MNLVYGEIVDVFIDGCLPGAKIRVGSAFKRISTALITSVAAGDTVLVCDGLAIGKVDKTRKESHVSGHSR